MREIDRWRRTAATVGVVAFALTACVSDDGGDDTDASPDTDAGADADADADAGGARPGREVATDLGVTEEPCPDAVNVDNGCIYLGVLSDLTQGPFAPLGVEIVEGQRAFWRHVNEDGGIAGHDVDIDEYTRDHLYDAQEQSRRYQQIEPNILALAQTLGTSTTEAILADMDADDMVGIPASWWSGWHFPGTDRGLILESGYSYCLEAQIGLDYVNEVRGEITSIQAVGYPGDYGGDFATGAEAWAEANGVEFLGFVETNSNAVVGSQDAAVGQVLSAGADVVAIATGPAEVAEIVGGAAAQGFPGRFLGSVPTWNPALLDSPAGPALESRYLHIGPWEDFSGESPAHEAMRASLGGELPTNDGFTSGWIWSYPLLAAMEAAVENGDLTRAGLRSVTDGLVVDYEDALPEVTLSDDAGQTAVRTAVINVPDPEAPLKLRSIATGVTGATADDYDYTGRCSG